MDRGRQEEPASSGGIGSERATDRLSLEPARLPPPALRSTLQAAPQPEPQGAVVGGRSARGERGRGAEEAKRGFGRLGDKQNERGFKRLKDSVSLLRWHR